MNSKHTPGPWVARRDQAGRPYVYCTSAMYGVLDWAAPGINAMANAKLIAAAPDMAKALQAVLERCPGIFGTDQESGETFDSIIRAALAKAGL